MADKLNSKIKYTPHPKDFTSADYLWHVFPNNRNYNNVARENFGTPCGLPFGIHNGMQLSQFIKKLKRCVGLKLRATPHYGSTYDDYPTAKRDKNNNDLEQIYISLTKHKTEQEKKNKYLKYLTNNHTDTKNQHSADDDNIIDQHENSDVSDSYQGIKRSPQFGDYVDLSDIFTDHLGYFFLCYLDNDCKELCLVKPFASPDRDYGIPMILHDAPFSHDNENEQRFFDPTRMQFNYVTYLKCKNKSKRYFNQTGNVVNDFSKKQIKKRKLMIGYGAANSEIEWIDGNHAESLDNSIRLYRKLYDDAMEFVLKPRIKYFLINILKINDLAGEEMTNGMINLIVDYSVGGCMYNMLDDQDFVDDKIKKK